MGMEVYRWGLERRGQEETGNASTWVACRGVRMPNRGTDATPGPATSAALRMSTCCSTLRPGKTRKTVARGEKRNAGTSPVGCFLNTNKANFYAKPGQWPLRLYSFSAIFIEITKNGDKPPKTLRDTLQGTHYA